MGRHERRASVTEFKRAAAGGYLDAHMLPADAPISNPLLQRAVEYWRGNIQQRRPVCISCKARFADGAQAGSYLTPLLSPCVEEPRPLCGRADTLPASCA
jgi:hypothetical protein